MNVGEMFIEVRERLGEDSENFWRDTAIYRALNQAAQRFTHEHRWSWLVMACTSNVTEDDETIDFIDNVDWTRHYSLRLVPSTGERDAVSPERVNPERANELKTLYATATSSEPRYYYLDHRVVNDYDPSGYGETTDYARGIGARVRLIPAADKDYTAHLRYFRNVRLLSATDTDEEPDCPIQYHDAIVALATGNLWLKELSGGTKAQEQFNVYNSILEQAKKDQTNEPEDGFLIFGGEQPKSLRRGMANVGAGYPYGLQYENSTGSWLWDDTPVTNTD